MSSLDDRQGRDPFGRDADTFFAVFYLRTPGARAVYRVSLEAIAERAAPRPGQRLLDIGCGNGLLLGAFSGSGARLVGLDRSPEMIALTARTAPEALAAVGDARSLPVASSSIDILVSRAVLQHVAELERALAEFRRVLRPKGRCVILVPVTNPLLALARSMASLLVPARRELSGTLRGSGVYLAALRCAGFRVLRAETFGLIFYALSGYGTGISVPLVPESLWRRTLAFDELLLRLPGTRWLGVNLLVEAEAS